MESLRKIQAELKAPKDQINEFGSYKYRSCEDILEAVKPLLGKYDCLLLLTDEIKETGSLMYVEATASITCGKDSISVKASAGIALSKKGMDISQSFGSSSSYARKYALNGLFLIDDTKDADGTNNHKEERKSLDVDAMTKICDNIRKGTRGKGDEAQKAFLSKLQETHIITDEQLIQIMDAFAEIKNK